MRLWIQSILLDGLMFSLLAAAIMGNGWAQNGVLFVSWVASICCVMTALAASGERKLGKDDYRRGKLLPVFLKRNGKDFAFYDKLSDFLFCIGLAAGGWYITAIIYVIGFSCKFTVKEEVLKEFGYTVAE